MKSQAKSSGIKILEVHGMGKNLDPNLKPEKQHAIPKQGSKERLCIGQGRAGSGRKRPDPINQSINQPSNLSQKIPGRTKIETRKTNHVHTKGLMHSINNANGNITNNNHLILDVLFHPGPVYRPLPKPIKQDASYPQSSQSSTDLEILIQILILKKTLHFRRASCPKHFRDWTNNFSRAKRIGNLINKIHKYLPKQTDIDKMLEVIQRKVLKGSHLPVEIKTIQAGYLHSSYFKDLYLYLSQNKLPSSKMAIKRVEALVEKYILLDSLLFKVNPEKERMVLTLPEACIDKIIMLYHSSLFAGHQGVIKKYLTISDKFFIPTLSHYLRSYISGCHLCHLV